MRVLEASPGMSSEQDAPVYESSWWYRLNQQFAATSFGSWLFANTVHYVDRILMGLTGGRVSMPGTFAGLPVVQLTTIGRKTGKERTLPLCGFRVGDDKWFVIASNYGKEEHPAWYRNLKANPEVKLHHEGETRKYVARDAAQEEWEKYWDRAADVYLGYEVYRDRAEDREIPIVVLEPPENGKGMG